ncbi:MAG: hypothetical protein A2X64_11060 [Ignavibacteria bacterium GWF2_33_9]|nr:MAG: hypothetical protein A2X64_11060 [Ignavibacteria bacterium GWF2_33_9]
MKYKYIIFFLILLLNKSVLLGTEIEINNKINIFAYNFNRISNNLHKIDDYLAINDINTNISDDNFAFFAAHLNDSKSENDEVYANENGWGIDLKYPPEDYVPFEQFTYADDPRYTFDGDPPLLKSHINYWNAAAVFASYSAIFYVQHSMQQSTIWKDVGTFQIQEDIQYALWVDKFGHFYGGYSTGYLLSEMLQLSGFSWESATWLGGALGFGYQTYIEVLDGMSEGWGFSPSDFYADIAGSAFFVAQYYFPILQNFTPKFTYVNPPWLGEKKRAEAEIFIDNYSSQIFWMSINVRNLFGGAIKEYCPDWLNLAVGYAAYSLAGWDWVNERYRYPADISHPVNPDVAGNRKFIVALDYNLVKLLPDGPPFWNWLKQSLNLFKLPSPALEIGFEGKTKFYLIYPFEFRFSGFRF